MLRRRLRLNDMNQEYAFPVYLSTYAPQQLRRRCTDPVYGCRLMFTRAGHWNQNQIADLSL